MAYEAGGSLDQVFKQQPNRTLSPSCAVSIAIQLGDVLHHLHTKAGLVHHDISPSNILLRNQLSPFRAVPPDVVLIDLAAADSPQNPRQRQIYGKKVYLPPERLLDPPTPVSYHIDIYSVGILLYELLSGQRPQQNTEDIQNPHTQLPAIREVNSAVSPELNDLVMQAAARNPEERKKHLPDMQHLVDRLKRVPEAQKPCQLRSPLTREAVMQLVPVIIAIVLLIGLLGSGAFWIPPILTPTPTATATLAPTPTATPSPTPTPTFTPTPTSIPPTSTPATSFAPEEISLLLMDGAMIALCSYG
jgi:serine/threonine-protein kinase